MKNDIFSSMKEQMVPDPSVEAALKYEIEKNKKTPLFTTVLRWGSAAAAATLAALLIFNLAMPAYAEKLPIVGTALGSLNELGNNNRANGKTPAFLVNEEEEKKDYTIAVTNAECNGLDVKFRMEINDLIGKVAPETEYLTLSDVTLEICGMYIYPTDENPRLAPDNKGGFSGWATFNSSPIASTLKSGEEIRAVLYCEGLSSYVEGATYEDVVSRYTYEFHEAVEFSVDVDLLALSVEYLGLEKYGINIQHMLTCEDRTDIIFTVDESVDYPSHFSVYTDNSSPRVITVSRAADGSGEYVYNATFVNKDSEEGESLEDHVNGLLEKDEVYYKDKPDSGDIILYSHATGEYYSFESEVEEE